MNLKQLLHGLSRNSTIGPAMRQELADHRKKLVQRSAANQNWSEDDQANLELIDSLLQPRSGGM